MKVAAEWMTLSLLYVFDVLEHAGYEVYAVGGCVRDAILGVACSDIDLATNAHPQEVRRLLEAKGLTVYDTGIYHGTVTVSNHGHMYEITTFRKDVATDGRRATVEYAETIEQDAQRRDFTMNALYMDCEGTIHDPTGRGIEDLKNGDVVFVGNAQERCEEDFLRILRLFRFHTRFGKNSLNKEAFLAAKEHAKDIVKNVSGERIWSELTKILKTKDPSYAVILMEASGVLGYILPNADVENFISVLNKENKAEFQGSFLLRFFGLNRTEIPFPHSKAEKNYLETLQKAVYSTYTTAQRAYLYGMQITKDAHIITGEGKSFDINELGRGLSAEFPVPASDLMEKGFEAGPELGKELTRLRNYWIDSNLMAEKPEILRA